MKKKYIVPGVLIVIAIITVFLFKDSDGKTPFKDMHMDDVQSVTVTLQPPNTTYDLTTEEIEELIDILQSMVIYNKDNSYRKEDGQGVIFSIIKKDGSTIDVMPWYDIFVIDGTGYKTEYEACEKLSLLGNKIGNLDF